MGLGLQGIHDLGVVPQLHRRGRGLIDESTEELYHRQCRYDFLHHQWRVAWLERKEKRSEVEEYMLKQSRACIARPVMGYHSVSLDDLSHIHTLDQFAKAEGKG
jgi:hypothetical protein